jgi:hypothetical protein
MIPGRRPLEVPPARMPPSQRPILLRARIVCSVTKTRFGVTLGAETLRENPTSRDCAAPLPVVYWPAPVPGPTGPDYSSTGGL